MKFMTLAVAWLTPLAALSAQDSVDASASKATLESIKSDLDSARSAYSAKVKEIQATDEYKQLRKGGDRKSISALFEKLERVDETPFIERAQGALNAAQHDESKLDILLWITANARNDPEPHGEAIEMILERHLGSDKLRSFAESLGYVKRTLPDFDSKAALQKIFDHSPHDVIKGTALYTLAQGVLRDRTAADEDKDAARADVERAAELAAGTTLALRIRGPKFREENLQIGMTAPDIEGVDLDGVAFKLSDYRGKVVVLDFWGDW